MLFPPYATSISLRDNANNRISKPLIMYSSFELLPVHCFMNKEVSNFLIFNLNYQHISVLYTCKWKHILKWITIGIISVQKCFTKTYECNECISVSQRTTGLFCIVIGFWKLPKHEIKSWNKITRVITNNNIITCYPK